MTFGQLPVGSWFRTVTSPAVAKIKTGKPRYGSGWEPAAIEAEDRPRGGCESEQCPFLGTKIQVLLELMDMPGPTHKMETGRGR